MTVEEFCATYPRLYHMAEASMWPSIQRHGLLSTSALLDLYGIAGTERQQIEHTRRADFIAVRHPELGEVLIRDQKPMSDATLAPVLDGMTPAEWYALLNARVFFWVDEDRLRGLLGAYRHRDNLVLTLDTATVMARHAARTTLSAINSGYSRRWAVRRGRDTFRSIADYQAVQRVNGRAVRRPVAECAVLGGVDNVGEALLGTRSVPGKSAEGRRTNDE